MISVSSHFRLRQNRRSERFVAAALLCALLFGYIGFPVLPRIAKSSKEAFPCAKCSCACSSAAQCWRSCCCFTNSEKVKWAEANGVEVPDFVYVAAASERKANSRTPCCSKPDAAKNGLCASDANVAADSQENEPKVVTIGGDWRCRGIAPFWLLLPKAMVQRNAGLALDFAGYCTRFTVYGENPISLIALPETPPPKANFWA